MDTFFMCKGISESIDFLHILMLTMLPDLDTPESTECNNFINEHSIKALQYKS